MKFCEKLQQLRRERGLTQEQLAEQLFVSRTAISKWESDRGYPSIDSLKAISQFFSVSIDTLLSSDTLLEACRQDQAQTRTRTMALLFGCLDLMALLLLFLPLFKQPTETYIAAVPLLLLRTMPPAIWAVLLCLVGLCALLGAALLVLRTREPGRLLPRLLRASVLLSALLVLTLILTQEPYAASLAFFLLLTKGALLLCKG